MAIREALGEAKAKERTVEVQTFVKKYLADAGEMKRGRDLGTHGFEHQELYLFPRESFAQTATAYAKARTANAIDDPAERDAAEAEDPPARAPDPGPLSKWPRTADDASAYCAICDCVLSSRDDTLWRFHVEGARHRANLAATRESPSPRPPSRAPAEENAVSINRDSPVARRSTRARSSSAADHPASARVSASTDASACAERVAGLADELLDVRRAQRDANRALEDRAEEIASLRASTASFFEDFKREAEVERSVWTERARAATERAERAEVAESSAERRARIAEERCRALADDLARVESDRKVAEEETRSARNEAKTLRDASARLEGALAASRVRLRAAEAPVGIAAAAGAPRVAGGGTSAGFRIPRVDEPPPLPPPLKPEPSPECCVCAEEYTNERVRHMFVGCQHACVCGECADVIWKQGPNKRACPICREKVKHRAIPFRPILP